MAVTNIAGMSDACAPGTSSCMGFGLGMSSKLALHLHSSMPKSRPLGSGRLPGAKAAWSARRGAAQRLHLPFEPRYGHAAAPAATLSAFDGVVARLARELVERARQLTEQINALEAELRPLVRTLAPSLLAIPGCGILSAAMILGETAGAHRFRNKDAYARFTGTAPIPVWSGSSKGKVRLNHGGNRTINTALHMIAVTQSRGYGPGKAYLDKLATAGKGRTEAIRLLRRRLSDAAFTALRTDERARASQPDRPEVAALPVAA